MHHIAPSTDPLLRVVTTARAPGVVVVAVAVTRHRHFETIRPSVTTGGVAGLVRGLACLVGLLLLNTVTEAFSLGRYGDLQPTKSVSSTANHPMYWRHRRLFNHSRLPPLVTRSSSTSANDPSEPTSMSTTPATPEGSSIYYQRIFYRFTKGSDVSFPDAITIEERQRFIPNTGTGGGTSLQPLGYCTLILRDGQVEDGEIGDDFLALDLDYEGGWMTMGGTTDPVLQSEIITAMYLACNPQLCTGRMLEVGCTTGIASLLGCIGAAYPLNRRAVRAAGEQDEMDRLDQSILTLGGGKNRDDGILPPSLDELVITSTDDTALNMAMHHCKRTTVNPSKVFVEKLDWKALMKPPVARRGGFGVSGTTTSPPRQFRTVVATDLISTFPETKALARTVANRVAPATTIAYENLPTTTGMGGATAVPTMVYICPDTRDEVAYLNRLLTQGYRMTTRTGYLKVEKLIFAPQIITRTSTKQTAEESVLLDEMELELLQVKELFYQSITAEHHPDYRGEGTGESFFPLETGEYDARSGSTYLEPDPGSSPW